MRMRAGENRERDWENVRSLALPDWVHMLMGMNSRSVLNGFDIDGRPILYMRPGHENTERSPRQVRHLVWWL